MNDMVGPTGKFPRGKLNEADEGELGFSVGQEKGQVRIDFGSPITWFAMPPDLALQFATSIAKHATALKR
jgi:hypothetical protein